MKYEERDGNYQYETNRRLGEKLRGYAAEIEACLGKTIKLPEGFFTFTSRNNKVIDWMLDGIDRGFAETVANACESYSWFDTYVNTLALCAPDRT